MLEEYNLMFFIQKIVNTVKSVDMFSSSEMLRYSEDSRYHTFTGGIISLGIIFTVISGFFSMISETIHRTAITANVNSLINSDPPAYNLTANAENMFMFGIQIQSSDLSFNYDFNGPRRYFDITAQQFILSYGIIQSSTQLPLVQCTDEHWKILPEIVSNKDQIMYNLWLCPPLDSKYLLQGSYFSEIFSSLLITAKKCTNQSDSSRPCYPQNQIDDLFTKYGNFYFTINYMNTVINQGEVNYRSYYLESMDFAIVSAGTGSELYYQFSDYEIETDTSIWPFSSYQYNKGALISQRVSPKPYMMGQGDNYVVAYIAKSSQSLRFRRQVQKLSVVISYIGGLVGAISAVLFILKVYTDLSLELSIAQSIFTFSQHQQHKDVKLTQANNSQIKKHEDKIGQKQFNIFIFTKLLIFKLLKKFKFIEGWTELKQIEILRKEISKHLDIKVLLQRLTNLQRCLSYVYDDDQLICLKYLKKISLHQVKGMRTVFSNEIQSAGQLIKQTQSHNQPFPTEDDNILSKNNVAKSNIFQIGSPSDLSNVQNTLFSVRSNVFQKVEVTKKTKRNQVAPLDVLPYNNFNQIVLDEKTIKSFSHLQRTKQTDTLSKKIWQNLNEKIKQQLFCKRGKSKILDEDKDYNRKRTYIHLQLPSLIMDEMQ